MVAPLFCTRSTSTASNVAAWSVTRQRRWRSTRTVVSSPHRLRLASANPVYPAGGHGPRLYVDGTRFTPTRTSIMARWASKHKNHNVLRVCVAQVTIELSHMITGSDAVRIPGRGGSRKTAAEGLPMKSGRPSNSRYRSTASTG
jgi:hypothetical protein